ncbi:MAG: endonuclease V [Actinobacteria bacterium]|nr:endonuclease V [Actinomycetota bacterium]
MDLEHVHPWRVTRAEAAAIQAALARNVVLRSVAVEGQGSPRYAAGVDVSYQGEGSRAWAAAVLMDRRFRIVETSVVEGVADSAYVAGYLAFREGRLTIESLTLLETQPDLVFIDGHGVVHERGLGLASHVGVVVGLPTVGVAKTPFHSIDHDPGPERGDHYVLTKEWGARGAAVRLKRRAKPVYVSPGHLVDLPSALALALAWSSGRHRVPEPLSAAHTLSLVARNERSSPSTGAATTRSPRPTRPSSPTPRRTASSRPT